MNKSFKKTALVMALMATLFNNCEAKSSETDKTPVKELVRNEQTKKDDSQKEIKAINTRIDELDKKIVDLLERFEIERDKIISESSYYNPMALVNPSDCQKSSYTQDAANSQRNSTVIFKYAPNQLYKIYCRVGYLTDLSLKKGETVTFVGGGDTSAWAVEKATVNGVAHIYIKPTVETNTTNLIITTNRRSYQLILNTSNWYNPMVTWTYGQEETELNLCEKESPLSKINGNIESLNFDYKISGLVGSKLVVFDDGEKTILKFDKMPKRLPSLFIKDKKGIGLANYKIIDGCYILDRVADEIELRISDKERIKIKRRK